MERRTNIFFSFHRQTVGTGQETVVRAPFVIFRGEEKSAQKKHSDAGHGDMLSVAGARFRKQTHAVRLGLVTYADE